MEAQVDAGQIYKPEHPYKVTGDRKYFNYCMICEESQTELRNYDHAWMDGDVHCALCGDKLRDWDAG